MSSHEYLLKACRTTRWGRRARPPAPGGAASAHGKSATSSASPCRRHRSDEAAGPAAVPPTPPRSASGSAPASSAGPIPSPSPAAEADGTGWSARSQGVERGRGCARKGRAISARRVPAAPGAIATRSPALRSTPGQDAGHRSRPSVPDHHRRNRASRPRRPASSQ